MTEQLPAGNQPLHQCGLGTYLHIANMWSKLAEMHACIGRHWRSTLMLSVPAHPSTAKFRVALGIRTFRPSSSLLAIIWHPSLDLRLQSLSDVEAPSDQWLDQDLAGTFVSLRFRQAKCKVEHVIFIILWLWQLVIEPLILNNDMTCGACQRALASTCTSSLLVDGSRCADNRKGTDGPLPSRSILFS